MKKLLTLVLLMLLAPQIWGVSAKPGSGLVHDGSLMPTWDDMGASDGVRRSSAMSKASVNPIGDKKILVILTSFNDYSFNTHYAESSQVHDQAYYRSLLQSGDGLTVKKYYKQQSREKLNLSFQVIGPYMVNRSYQYYGETDAAGDNKRPGKLVYDVLNLASGDIDADLDTCTVIIIHAGPGGEEGRRVGSNFIWSHKSSISERRDYAIKYNIDGEKSIEPVTIGDNTFDNYIIVPEFSLWGNIAESTIGVYCHELGHIFGLLDAYDQTYATAGVGQWSLMGGGEWGTMGDKGVAPGSDPAPFMAWELVKLGWVTEENITPALGSDKRYTFSEINSQSKVYRVNLGGDQYLTLEGKKKNLSGEGLAVYESGLLISQIHNGIIDTYGPKNKMNYSGYRPHGSMVVEAKAANYMTNGLGNLWRSGAVNANRTTTTALFRSGTLTSLGPENNSGDTDLAFLPLFITTVIGSGFAISMVAALYAGRRRLCFIIAALVTATCISMSCVIESGSGGGGGGGAYDKGPNTNYYTSISNVHSKTGYSGITIYNIQCDENGNGSFYIKKE